MLLHCCYVFIQIPIIYVHVGRCIGLHNILGFVQLNLVTITIVTDTTILGVIQCMEIFAMYALFIHHARYSMTLYLHQLPLLLKHSIFVCVSESSIDNQLATEFRSLEGVP